VSPTDKSSEQVRIHKRTVDRDGLVILTWELVHQKAPEKPLASAMGRKGCALGVALVFDILLDYLDVA
jgi:hypothetical protein